MLHLKSEAPLPRTAGQWGVGVVDQATAGGGFLCGFVGLHFEHFEQWPPALLNCIDLQFALHPIPNTLLTWEPWGPGIRLLKLTLTLVQGSLAKEGSLQAACEHGLGRVAHLASRGGISPILPGARFFRRWLCIPQGCSLPFSGRAWAGAGTCHKVRRRTWRLLS